MASPEDKQDGALSVGRFFLKMLRNVLIFFGKVQASEL